MAISNREGPDGSEYKSKVGFLMDYFYPYYPVRGIPFSVPTSLLSHFGHLTQLNAHLLQRCQDDMHRRIRGHKQIKQKLLQEEQFSLLALPFVPFDACRIQAGRVNCQLLVRFDCNDYSAPMEYGYQDVTVKGYTDRVQICRLNEVIARAYERLSLIVTTNLPFESWVAGRPG